MASCSNKKTPSKSRWADHPHYLLALVEPGGINLFDVVSAVDPEILKVAEGLAPAAMLEGLSPAWIDECRRQALVMGLYAFAPESGDTLIVACDPDTVNHVRLLRRRVRGRRGEARRECVRRFGELFGYPECCIEFFARFEDELDDLLWIKRSLKATKKPCSATRARRVNTRTVYGLNPMISHVPCSLDCPATIRMADVLAQSCAARLGVNVERLEACLDHQLVIWDEKHFFKMIPSGVLVAPEVPSHLLPSLLEQVRGLIEQNRGISIDDVPASWVNAMAPEIRPSLIRNGEVVSREITSREATTQEEASREVTTQEAASPEVTAQSTFGTRISAIQFIDEDVSFAPDVFLIDAASRLRWKGYDVALERMHLPPRSFAEDDAYEPPITLTSSFAKRPDKTSLSSLMFSRYIGSGRRVLLKEVHERTRRAEVVLFDRWVPREVVEAALPARTLCLLNHPSGKESETDASVPSADMRSVVRFVEENEVSENGGRAVACLPMFPIQNPYSAGARRETVYHTLTCHKKPPCSFCGDSLYTPIVEGGDIDAVQHGVRELARIRKENSDCEEVLFYSTDFVRWCRALIDAAGRDIDGIDLLFQARVDDLLENWSDLEKAAEQAALYGGRLHAYLVGLENFSDAELKRLGKGISSSQVCRAVTKLLQLESRCRGFVASRYAAHGFILFNPWTTIADLKENLQRSMELGLSGLRREYPLTKLRLYPRTKLFEKARKEGLLLDITLHGEWQAFLKGYAPHFSYRFLHEPTQDVYNELMRRKVTGHEDEVLRDVLRRVCGVGVGGGKFKPLVFEEDEKGRVEAGQGDGELEKESSEAEQGDGEAVEESEEAKQNKNGAHKRNTRAGISSKRVLLIQPPHRIDSQSGGRGALPSGYLGVGILSIEAYLRKHGVDVTLLHLGDENLCESERLELVEEALVTRPDLVAVGMNWVHTSLGALQLADFVQRHSRAPVVTGGQHASLFSKEIARDYGHIFNAIIKGPAEIALTRLLGEKELYALKQTRGKIIQGSLCEQPDKLPHYSYRSAIPRSSTSSNNVLAALSSVRGHCPRKCSYCLESWGLSESGHGPLRVHSTSWLVEQIKRFVLEGRDIITIQDPFFIFGDEPLISLVEALSDDGIALRELNLFTEPGAYTPRAWDALSSGPFELVTVDLGVESGSVDRLHDAGRMYTNDDVLCDIKELVSRDILPYTWWMTGLPGETWEDIEATAKILYATMKAGAVPRWITPMVLFPKTSAFGDAPRSGVIPRLRFFEDFFVFSTTPHRPTGYYPELITHETSGLSVGRILAGCYALKRQVVENWDLLTSRHSNSPRWGNELARLGSMLSDEEGNAKGFSMDTIF